MSQQIGGYPPATSAGASTGQTSAQPSTQVARDEAGEVGRTAADAGRQVAGTAAEQAANVAQEAKTQVRDLVGEARGQVSHQARAGQQKATDGIRALGKELREVAEGGQPSGTASEIARQAAQRVDRLADWFGEREPADLLNEVRTFARRRPGAFLLGASVAGVVVGRLTRGAVDSARADSESTPQRAYGGYPASTPLPYDSPAQPRPYTPAASTSPPRSTVGGVGPEPFDSPTPPAGTHAPRPGATSVGDYVDEIDRTAGERRSARSTDPLNDPLRPGPGDAR
jgi:hypothetical protein